MKLPHQLHANKGYHTLDFGPLYWQDASEEIMSLLRNHQLDDAGGNRNNHLLPTCSDNTNNEYILQGGWIEDHLQHPPHILNMSLEAEWTPFDCTLDYSPKNRIPNTIRHFRLGDSTMPGKIVKDFNDQQSINKGN